MYEGLNYQQAFKAFQRRFLLEKMIEHKGNQCKVAEDVGIHRNSINRLITRLDLDGKVFRPRNSETQAFRELLRERDGPEAGSELLDFPKRAA